LFIVLRFVERVFFLFVITAPSVLVSIGLQLRATAYNSLFVRNLLNLCSASWYAFVETALYEGFASSSAKRECKAADEGDHDAETLNLKVPHEQAVDAVSALS